MKNNPEKPETDHINVSVPFSIAVWFYRRGILTTLISALFGVDDLCLDSIINVIHITTQGNRM